jgi:peptidoglycan/xylan/chitin deacetylase (PgdA/CDA1 family)
MLKKLLVIKFLLVIGLGCWLVGFYAINFKQKTQPETPGLFPPTIKTLNLPILMYHHVGDLPKKPNLIRKDLTVSKENFKQQVEYIHNQGFVSIKLEDIYSYALGSKRLPNKPIIFTFDDGYEDVFKNALPVLEHFGFTGTVALITEFQGTTIGDNTYSDWQAINRALSQGHEMVSHTHTHFDGANKKYTDEFIQNNLKNSLISIEKNTGIKTLTLVYPYGHYTPNYIALAKSIGFKLGLTTKEGSQINLDNLMEIPRLRIHRTTTLQQLIHKLSPANLAKSPTTK